jgi:hypothetical protein
MTLGFLFYSLVAVVLTIYQGYRGFMLRGSFTGQQGSNKSLRMILYCLADTILYVVCTLTGFASIWLAYQLSVRIPSLPAISIGTSILLVFLVLLGLLGVTGQLPHLIQQQKFLRPVSQTQKEKQDKELTASTDQKDWFQRHPRLTLFSLQLFGCIIVLMLAEAAARVFFPGLAPNREERVKFWEYDDLLGWSHRPNQRGRFNHPDFSVEVSINSLGMRDREYPRERTEKKRMLVLGDSFGFGFGVEHNQRFSELLENRHLDWEIMDGSVSGYGTDQEFLYLKERGIALRPDVVLLLFCENDFGENISSQAYWHFKPFFTVEAGKLRLHNVPVPRPTIRQRTVRFLRGRTYLGSILIDTGHRLLELVGLEPSSTEENMTPDKETLTRMYDVTYHLITAMNELCKKNGCRFVLASVPMDSEMRTLLQRIAEENKISYLPLDEYFETSFTVVTFAHDQHWNPRGHEIAANAIDAFLQKLGVFHSSTSGQ